MKLALLSVFFVCLIPSVDAHGSSADVSAVRRLAALLNTSDLAVAQNLEVRDLTVATVEDSVVVTGFKTQTAADDWVKTAQLTSSQQSSSVAVAANQLVGYVMPVANGSDPLAKAQKLDSLRATYFAQKIDVAGRELVRAPESKPSAANSVALSEAKKLDAGLLLGFLLMVSGFGLAASARGLRLRELRLFAVRDMRRGPAFNDSVSDWLRL